MTEKSVHDSKNSQALRQRPTSSGVESSRASSRKPRQPIACGTAGESIAGALQRRAQEGIEIRYHFWAWRRLEGEPIGAGSKLEELLSQFGEPALTQEIEREIVTGAL
jgi:hypothetical protein